MALRCGLVSAWRSAPRLILLPFFFPTLCPAAAGRRKRYQPPPPPPPPPPPDEPPPPEPLLDPGAVEADATVLARLLPTVLAKLPGSSHTLRLPTYQPIPLCRDGSAAAAARTLSNRPAQRFSTPSAMAWGR